MTTISKTQLRRLTVSLVASRDSYGYQIVENKDDADVWCVVWRCHDRTTCCAAPQRTSPGTDRGCVYVGSPGSSTPARVHGAFVSDEEVNAVSADLQSKSQPVFIDEVTSGQLETPIPGEASSSNGDDDSESDPLFDEAVALVTESRNASISSVQRKLRIGYNRAARIVEKMEEIGIVGELESNGKREVLAPPPPED